MRAFRQFDMDHQGKITFANLRAVARELGASTSTVTHYYASREEMLEAAFTRLQNAFRESLSAISELEAPESRLRALLLGCLPGREPHYLAYLAFSVSPQFSDRVVADLSVQHGLMVSLVGGRVALADAVLALADGIAVNAIMDPEGWPSARQESVLWAGVGAMGLVSGDNF